MNEKVNNILVEDTNKAMSSVIDKTLTDEIGVSPVEPKSVNIEFFDDDDFAIICFHIESESQLQEAVKYVKEKKFINCKIYYKED